MKQTISPQELEAIISTTLGSRAVEKLDVRKAAEICLTLYKDEQRAISGYRERLSELKEEAKSISERGNVTVYVPSRICVQPVYLHLPKEENWIMMSYVPLGPAGVQFGEAGLRSPDVVFEEMGHSLFEEDQSGSVRLSNVLCGEIPYMAPLEGTSWEEWRERIILRGTIRDYERFVSDSIMDEKTLSDSQLSFFQSLYEQAERYKGKSTVTMIKNDDGTGSICGVDLSEDELYIRNVLIPVQLAFQRLQDKLFRKVIEHDEGFKIHYLDHQDVKRDRTTGPVYRRHNESIEADLAGLE